MDHTSHFYSKNPALVRRTGAIDYLCQKMTIFISIGAFLESRYKALELPQIGPCALPVCAAHQNVLPIRDNEGNVV